MNSMKRDTMIVRYTGFFLAMLLALFSSGCRNAVEEPQPGSSGRLAYVQEVASINGDVYVLRRTIGEGCGLYRLSGTDEAEMLVRSFPSDAAALSSNGKVFYHVDGEALYTYDIASGTSQPLCSPSSGCLYIDAVTAHYLLFTDENRSKRCAALDTGEVTELTEFSTGSAPILWLDAELDTILFWDDAASAICLFHIADDSKEVLMQREQDVSRVMVTACLFQDTLYYAESDGVLYTGSNGDPQAVEATEGLKVVGLLPEDDSLLLAIRWNSIKMKLYRLSDNNLEELAIWDARYLHSSCGLFAAENTAYCYLKTDSALHSLPLA